MTRGKHSSASLARRYAVAEQDIRDWKRHSTEQKREIDRLRSEVNLMPALRERVQVLEMQLDLATCSEIADLNKTVARQREEIAQLEADNAHTRDLLMRSYRYIGPAHPKSAAHILEEIGKVLGTDVAFPDVAPDLVDKATVIPQSIPTKVGRKLGSDGVRAVARARGEK